MELLSECVHYSFTSIQTIVDKMVIIKAWQRLQANGHLHASVKLEFMNYRSVMLSKQPTKSWTSWRWFN